MTAMVVPPVRVAGETGHIGDHNNFSANFAVLNMVLPGWLNVVTGYGADPSGVTDSATAIQNAVNAAAAGQAVYFPPGTYLTGSTIQVPGYSVLLGWGKENTIIKMAAGANLDAVMASSGWTASSATSSVFPITMSQLTIDGNSSAQSGGAGHGMVLQTYRSTITDNIFQNTGGDGLRFDTQGANGTTTISNTAVENRVERCQARSNGGIGINVHDPAFNKLTDGFLTGCIVASPGLVTPGPAISVQAGAGWKITGNHAYGSIPTSGILVSRPYMTRVESNYIEAWGATATAGTYSAIDFRAGFMNDGGNGSAVEGNTCRFAATAGNAASVIYGIAAEAASSDVGNLSIAGNVLAAPVTPPANSIAIALICQNSASVLTARVTGNTITGTWPGGNIVKGSTGTVHVLGTLLPVAVKTSAYTASAGDLVPVDTTSGAVTVTLPSAPPDGSAVVVKMVVQGGTNTVTVACAGSDVLNKASGPTTVTLPLVNQGITLQYKSSSAIWYVLSDDLPLTGLDSRYVASVTAADTSVVVGGTGAAPTVRTATLDVVAAQHPPAADWSNNSHKITSMANGTTSSDGAAYGQTPAGGSTVTIGQGGTGQVTQQAALDAIAGAVTSAQFLRGNGTHVTMSAIQAADMPAGTTSAQGALQLDGTAANILALGTQAAGANGKAADSGHVHPLTALMAKVADVGDSGVALINNTQTFASWTAPNDGHLHSVLVMCTLVVATTATGGAVGYTFTDPAGNVRTNFQILTGGQASGVHLLGFTTVVVKANTVFSLVQTSALTGGAATIYGQIFAA